MLKIKDNVDLKELEKYGFKYDKYGDLRLMETMVNCLELVLMI